MGLPAGTLRLPNQNRRTTDKLNQQCSKILIYSIVGLAFQGELCMVVMNLFHWNGMVEWNTGMTLSSPCYFFPEAVAGGLQWLLVSHIY